MLRLRFSPSDLGRVRLRGTLGPLVETLLALQTLGSHDLGPYGEWRRRVLARLPSVAAAARSLPPGAAAGLYAQSGPAATVEQAMVALRGLNVGRSHTSGRREHSRLAALLAVSYESGIAPNWPAMLAHLDAEYANRARVLAEGGIDRLFGTLHPGLSWRPPVLELHGQPAVGIELDLAGRGLDVVPAVFCLAVPEIFLPPAGPAVLIYPAGADPATTPRPEPADAAVPDGLADLLGQTRAAVLAALAGGSTTGELARKLRISPAGASQHATVLRRAGLILSTRRGNSVLHTLTPLGSALLNRP
jgi:DNA-binding transcriptional ArsR family regulator